MQTMSYFLKHLYYMKNVFSVLIRGILSIIPSRKVNPRNCERRLPTFICVTMTLKEAVLTRPQFHIYAHVSVPSSWKKLPHTKSQCTAILKRRHSAAAVDKVRSAGAMQHSSDVYSVVFLTAVPSPLAHCLKSSFFVQKFNFDFPRKLSILFG